MRLLTMLRQAATIIEEALPHFFRIDEAGNSRITEDGSIRIV